MSRLLAKLNRPKQLCACGHSDQWHIGETSCQMTGCRCTHARWVKTL